MTLRELGADLGSSLGPAGNPTLTASDREASIKAVVSKLPKASEVRRHLSRCMTSRERV
jgi:hypothetical protein